MAKTSEKHRVEVEALRERSLMIVRFISGHAPTSPLLSGFEDAIQAAFDRGDLGGLKMVSTDMAEWARDLPARAQQELDGLLQGPFGLGLRPPGSERTLARIIKRGKVVDEDEYRLLLSRAEEIHSDPSKQTELVAINQVLGTFHPTRSTDAS